MSWKIRNIDYYVLIPYLVLCLISAVMVFSASGLRGNGTTTNTSILFKQVIFILVGFFLCALVFLSRLRIWKVPGYLAIALLVDVGMLAYLLVKGRAVNGASAWISIGGGFNIQPSEIAKLLVILYLAHILERRQRVIGHNGFWRSVRLLAWPLGLTIVVLLLILAQPDTGGTIIIGAVAIVMLIASGFEVTVGLIALFGGGAAAAGGFYFAVTKLAGFLQHSYQGKRLLAAVHPFAMQQGAGKQLVNSFYAINHGGLFGVGLGNSQMKLGYLPEPYTDFILSIISEELGMIGGLVVIGLLVFLILRIYRIGIRSRSTYRTMLMYGIATMILIQTCFNVGAVLGLLPITGVTLPFISYGGSSMLILAISMGLVLNVSASDAHDRELQTTAKESKN